jgi:hypothetical protein
MSAKSQFLMDLIDTSKDVGKGIFLMYKKFDHIRMSGYIQPQFQIASSEGASSYIGGDFAPEADNRFMLRRGRIRFDYFHFTEKKGPSVQFVFQFDGTERGVFIRDFWGRILENKFKLFAFTTGMFARPFGYEVNLSSVDRESPERGRMSQILMKNERDLGAMISVESRKKNHPLKYFKLDLGLFNGQGLTANTDFDSHKDLIARLAVKPFSISQKVKISSGISFLNGGFLQNSKYSYTVKEINNQKNYVLDSSLSNFGSIAPRKYYGADAQLMIQHGWGSTELRTEYMNGIQTGTVNGSETPAGLLTNTDAYYHRYFNGAYFYLLQNIINEKHQLALKLDWYDPNTKVAGQEIGLPGNQFNAADIKYTTTGIGYINYMTENLKLILWFDKVKNERTSLMGYTDDRKDDVFTFRLQYRF